jgi:PAS domain-containing protein
MNKKAYAAVAALFSITACLMFFHGHARGQEAGGLLSGDITAGASRMEPLIERYSADKRSLDRHYSIAFSQERFDRYETFYQEWQNLVNGIDFPGLGLDGQVDYVVFQNLLERELNALKKDKQDVRETLPLLPFAEKVAALSQDLRQMKWIKGKNAAAALNDIREQTEKAEQALESDHDFDKMTLRRAAAMVSELRESLQKWFEFHNGYDPVFTWWTAETHGAAEQALTSYAAALRKTLGEGQPGGTVYAIREPVGRGVLMEELAYEFIPYTPEEILAIGWKEMDWCEEQRLAASRELGFGDDWQEAMEHVKNKYPEPGEQPETIRYMIFEAIDFLEKQDCLTIPPMVKELQRMNMMPLERQQSTPFFTGGEVISVAYPADVVPFERKMSTMRGNNPHFSRAVVHHEMVPGHNLQGFMAARHRTYRRPFSTSFYGEGWPLYWEMRLWDLDFQRSPEDRIGMLFWRMHRCARIIFSLSFHLGQMTVDECIDLLVERVGHERALAEVEVKAHLSGRAYGGRPLAQISYLTGGLQLRALSKEIVDSGKMTPKEFHDAVLRENSIPIELLRAKLTGRRLSPNYKAEWKFYEVLK